MSFENLSANILQGILANPKTDFSSEAQQRYVCGLAFDIATIMYNKLKEQDDALRAAAPCPPRLPDPRMIKTL
jgi:hypothetical protein